MIALNLTQNHIAELIRERDEAIAARDEAAKQRVAASRRNDPAAFAEAHDTFCKLELHIKYLNQFLPLARTIAAA